MKIITSKSRSRRNVAENILCISVDRLCADALGAYGSSQPETPGFDALAAQSVLFDSYCATSLDLQTLFRAFWRGESPASIRAEEYGAEPPVSLFRELRALGYRTYVVSDDESVALHPCVESEDCDDRFVIDRPESTGPAEEIEQTSLFHAFEELARMIMRLEDERESAFGDSAPWFVWAHFSGMNDLWDFPLTLREEFRDEDDPAPYSGTVPPYWRRLPSARGRRLRGETSGLASEADVPGADPKSAAELARLSALDEADRRQSMMEAYFAGIAVFDETLAGFTALLEERRVLRKTLFILSGTRGCATGAPSGLGIPGADSTGSPFYSEETRLPLLIRYPDATRATLRLATLCEPRDVCETIRSWRRDSEEIKKDEFWRIEETDVSPFAGRWSADPEPVQSVAKDAENSDSDQTAPAVRDVPGVSLTQFLADEDGSARDEIVVVAKDADSKERAVVTRDWFFKRTPVPKDEEDPDAPEYRDELFVQPDDRYCVNDVADRCQDVAEGFAKRVE